jgi:tetratricopeptide (TPR) repeat protein
MKKPIKSFLILVLSTLVPNLLFAQELPTYASALSLFKAGSYEESSKMIQSSILSNTATHKEYVLLSHCNWAKGNINASIDNLFSALKLKPNDTEIYIEIIKAHIAASRFKGALELMETADTKFPNSKELKLQKAFLIGKYGKINTGLGIIETLKQEAPNDPRPLALEANLYFLQGDLEKAEMSLKWAISLENSSPFFHNNLALIYERMSDMDLKAGKKEKAKENLLEAEKSISKAISLKEYSQSIATLKRIQEKLSAL